METGRVQNPLTAETLGKLSAPPGFISLTSFLLKKIDHSEEDCPPTALKRASGRPPRQEPMEISASNMVDVEELKRSLGSRPWILYDPRSRDSTDSDSEKSNEATTWSVPEDSKTNMLKEAPVFYPTEEEFKDTLTYIANIRHRAEPHGICRIVPPSSWMLPCVLKENSMWENSAFTTQVQLFGGIENQNACNKMADGDARSSSSRTRLEHRIITTETGPEFTLEKFKKHADCFKEEYFSMKGEPAGSSLSSTSQKLVELSVQDVEREYRQLVENPKADIEVLCRDDLDTRVFGSGFPSEPDPVGTSESHKYLESGWNLNYTPRLPGSLLSLEDKNSSSVLVPRLHIGMCFSSISWTVEKHYLYSLCYLHLGAPRVWYVSPGRYSYKFEETTRRFLPNSSSEECDLHHKPVMKMSPFALKAEGIPICRCIQNPGEFVIIFPRSYYSGFDCGFNCSEIVNFAPLDWLPYGQIASELYREKRKKPLVSHEKLLLGAAREAVKAQWESSLLRKNTLDNIKWKDACGKDGILLKALKLHIKQERNRREYLSTPSQSQKMDKYFDSTSRGCCICFYDLHLSAVQCPCSVDRYSCLNHAKQLCSCAWSNKIFLFRYTLDELNVLAEALQGKLSSVYRFAREDLNLSLCSSISGKCEEKSQTLDSCDNSMVASIKAEVKARVHAKWLKEMKVDAVDSGVSSGKTDDKSISQVETIPDASDESLSVSSSSESDDSSSIGFQGGETQSSFVEGMSSRFKECTSSKKDVAGSSKPSTKSATRKKLEKPSNVSASKNTKKRKTMRTNTFI